MNRTQIYDLQDSKEIRGNQLNRVKHKHTQRNGSWVKGEHRIQAYVQKHPILIRSNQTVLVLVLLGGAACWSSKKLVGIGKEYGACERETVQYGAWGRTSPDLDTRLDSAHSVASPRPSSIGEYSFSLSARSLSPFTGLACFLVTGSLPRSLLHGRVFLMVRRSFSEQVWGRCDPQKQKQSSTVDHSCDCGTGTPINTVCLAADPNGVSKIYSNG